jgi:hypothetical protein
MHFSVYGFGQIINKSRLIGTGTTQQQQQDLRPQTSGLMSVSTLGGANQLSLLPRIIFIFYSRNLCISLDAGSPPISCQALTLESESLHQLLL